MTKPQTLTKKYGFFAVSSGIDSRIRGHPSAPLWDQELLRISPSRRTKAPFDLCSSVSCLFQSTYEAMRGFWWCWPLPSKSCGDCRNARPASSSSVRPASYSTENSEEPQPRVHTGLRRGDTGDPPSARAERRSHQTNERGSKWTGANGNQDRAINLATASPREWTWSLV